MLLKSSKQALCDYQIKESAMISPLGVLLDDIEKLELLKAVSSDGTTGLGEVRGPHSITLATTINLAESAHSNSATEVNLPRHRGFTKIKPQVNYPESP